MEPNQKVRTQAGSIGEILNGKADLSCLMWVSIWLENDDPFKWNCQMTEAILKNQPINVLQLAGSHHFSDPFQKSIAAILVECACEMIKTESIPAPKVAEVALQKSIDSLSEFKQENLVQFDNPKRLKLKHNARQALIRHHNAHNGTLSKDDIQLYVKKYDETAEEICRYFDEIPSTHGGISNRRRSNPESVKTQETI